MRWAVATTPRTGAHMLGGLLTAQGWGPCDEWGTTVAPDFPNTEPWGWILHWWTMPVDLSQFDVIVFLTRRSVNKQAESWAGARVTGRWFDGSTRGIAPATPELIGQIKTHNGLWRAALKPYSPIRVAYEDLAADPDAVAGMIVERAQVGG